jgi:flagellar basal body-associated protein FliL
VKNQAIGNLILKILIILVAVAAVVATVFLVVKANSDNRQIRKDLTVEAGITDFSANDFLRDKSLTARFSAESQSKLRNS